MLLGIMHLAFTYFGDKLHPSNSALLAQLKSTPPVISRQISMWKAWIGFNASHSLGAILFGVIFGYLVLEHPYSSFIRIFSVSQACSRWVPTWR